MSMPAEAYKNVKKTIKSMCQPMHAIGSVHCELDWCHQSWNNPFLYILSCRSMVSASGAARRRMVARDMAKGAAAAGVC